WAVEIVERLHRRPGINMTAITGNIVTPPKANVISVWSRDLDGITLARRLEFVGRYTRKALSLLGSSHYDVFHHILPFMVHSTFDPVALTLPQNMPFVLGPVQGSLGVDTSDELGVQDRNFETVPEPPKGDR